MFSSFELNNLIDLERWQSLNSIKCHKRYTKFITDLPKPIVGIEKVEVIDNGLSILLSSKEEYLESLYKCLE